MHYWINGQWSADKIQVRQDVCKVCGCVRISERTKEWTKIVEYRLGEERYEAVNEPECIKKKV